jgi:CBS domain-containing protein
MKLQELLAEGIVRIPLEAESLSNAIEQLVVPGSWISDEAGEPAPGAAILRGLHDGSLGSLRRVSPASLLVPVPMESGKGGWASLGVSRAPLVDESDGDPDPGPRIVLLVRPPGKGDRPSTAVFEQVIRALRDPSVEARLLSASSPEDARGVRRLLEAELITALRVEHILTPLRYRVFPDTPLNEVVDLMARRGLQAIPVVGREMEVLGMVTAAEALKHAVQQKGRGGERGRSQATARDIMSRSVICLSESHDIADAAQLMVNKEVGQFPVIRDGEIVGILTRDALLGALLGER